MATPFGYDLFLVSNGTSLVSCSWERQENETEEDDILHLAKKELAEYFQGKRREFSVPLSYEGTPFQKAVSQVMRTIPYGKTMTYVEIAKAIGKEGSAIAVGQACKRNRIVIFNPCHRVVPSNGKLGHYAGGKLDEIKKKLIDVEKGK